MAALDLISALMGGGFASPWWNAILGIAGGASQLLGEQAAQKANYDLLTSSTGMRGSGLAYLGEDSGIPQYYLPSTELTWGNYDTMRDQIKGDQYQNRLEFDRLQGNAKAMQAGREGVLNNAFGQMAGRLGGAFNSAYGGLLGQYDQAFAPITQGYQDRFSRNMAYLEGAGEQEKKDIDAAFRSQQSSVAQDLQARGLNNTTVRQSMQSGVESARVNEQGRLAERLRQQRLATDAALSGDLLNAQAQVAGNRMNLATGLADKGFGLAETLAREQMGLTEQLSSERMNMQSKLDTDYFNIARDDRAQLTSLLGQAQAQDYAGRQKNADVISNILAGTQISGPDQGQFFNLLGNMGVGYGEAQRLASLNSPGGLGSWFNAGTGMAAGAGVAGIGGLAAHTLLAPMTPLGWGLTLGAGTALGGLGGMMFGRRS